MIHLYFKESITGQRIGLERIQIRLGSYRFNFWR